MSIANETIPWFFNEHGKLQLALVWVPEQSTHQQFVHCSQALAWRGFRNSVHKLVSGNPMAENSAHTGTVADGGLWLAEGYSLPHMNIMSFNATPAEAADFVDIFSGARPRRELARDWFSVEPGPPQLVKSYSPDVKQPYGWRFVGYSVHMGLKHSDILVEVQKAADDILYYMGIVGLTSVRAWNPYMRLAHIPDPNLQVKHPNSDYPVIDGLPKEYFGELGLGIRGRHGELPCLFASLARLQTSSGFLPALPQIEKSLQAIGYHL